MLSGLTQPGDGQALPSGRCLQLRRSKPELSAHGLFPRLRIQVCDTSEASDHEAGADDGERARPRGRGRWCGCDANRSPVPLFPCCVRGRNFSPHCTSAASQSQQEAREQEKCDGRIETPRRPECNGHHLTSSLHTHVPQKKIPLVRVCTSALQVAAPIIGRCTLVPELHQRGSPHSVKVKGATCQDIVLAWALGLWLRRNSRH